ncbi:hypothetical protein C7B67_16485 [filamentous cyanobacterium Phorm 6]|nr:hypothetical protein C7B67_16485 [filamentous cyanobacterium Phorm 6]
MDVTVLLNAQNSASTLNWTFTQCRQTAPGDKMILQQQHQIVVERKFNPNSTVVAFGKTAEEAADKVFEQAREYGYWDATKTYPVETNSETAPDPGTGQR